MTSTEQFSKPAFIQLNCLPKTARYICLNNLGGLYFVALL